MSESSAVDKALLAFLNGLCKRMYFGDTEITDDFLRDEVLGGITEDEYAVLLKRFGNILGNLVTADMDFTQLEAFLTSQLKRRQNPLSEKQVATVTRFWKNQKSKIHQRLVESGMWGSKLKEFSWRIDVKTKARHIEQLNTPTSIMELQLENEGGDNEATSEMIRFEVDDQKVSGMLKQVADIEKAIETYAHT